MKKIIILLSVVIILIMILLSVNYTVNLNGKTIKIDGTTYAITIDGVTQENLPLSGKYYLDSYNCTNNSIITWDYFNHDLYIEKITSNTESCLLNFKSGNLPLSKMEVGDYVAYVGNNGCLNGATGTTGTSDAEAGNACKGENANQSIDENGTYGYCYLTENRFHVYGWRIAYIDDGKAHLISAGAPECRTRVSSVENATQIADLNSAALNYCNATYADGGTCSESNTWAMGNYDFRRITYEISGVSMDLTTQDGRPNCVQKFSLQECGYNNDLIDNGGDYWFAKYYLTAEHTSFTTYGVFWYGPDRLVGGEDFTYPLGFRPVIKLSSSVYVTGGSGTMENPYTIGI